MIVSMFKPLVDWYNIATDNIKHVIRVRVVIPNKSA